MRTVSALILGVAIAFVALGHGTTATGGIGAPASPIQGTPVTSTPVSTTTTTPPGN
jgi:hypothetical protein